MTIGVISTAALAGVIVFLLMLGVKKMVKNFRAGGCCGAMSAGQGCQGCTCCHEEVAEADHRKIQP